MQWFGRDFSLSLFLSLAFIEFRVEDVDMRLHCMTHWEFVNGTIGLHIPRILINHDSLWIYCGIDVFKSCFFSPEFELVKTSWMHSNDISFEARESKLQNYELNKFPKIYGNSTQNCLNCWFYIHGRHCIVSNTHTHTCKNTNTLNRKDGLFIVRMAVDTIQCHSTNTQGTQLKLKGANPFEFLFFQVCSKNVWRQMFIWFTEIVPYKM